MAKSVDAVAGSIRDFLMKNTIDVWTMRWPDFYKVTERERMKEEFMEQLRGKLRDQEILITYGKATVVICRDFNFSPRPWK
jgi:hypothetical protein